MRRIILAIILVAGLTLVAIPAVSAQSRPASTRAASVQIVAAPVEHGQARNLSNTLAAWSDIRYGPSRIQAAIPTGTDANGDGNACLDQVVGQDDFTIIKVQMCVGQRVAGGHNEVYVFAFIRCGRTSGGYWTGCNFGFHQAQLLIEPNLFVISHQDAAKLNVSTWTWRGAYKCGYYDDIRSYIGPYGGDSRGLEFRGGTLGLKSGRTAISNVYGAYPVGCAP